MSEMYDLSVSIVTFNNSKEIGAAIDSLVSSIGNDLSYKLFVIDNNSSDNTSEEVQKRRMDGRINLISLEKNVGFGSGHNVVLELLNSKYHLIMNPDILVKGNAISRIVDFLEKNDDVGLVSPNIVNPDGSIQYSCKRDPTILDLLIRLLLPNCCRKRQERYMMKDHDHSKVFDAPIVSGCFMFLRTELLKRVNGFDERFFLYFEDTDLCKRIGQHSRIVYFPYATVSHEWKRESRRKLKLLITMMSSAIKYAIKWRIRLF